MNPYQEILIRLEIEFEWDSDYKAYIADAKVLPGTPPIGTGQTKDAAVAVLLARVIAKGPRDQYFKILKEKLIKPKQNISSYYRLIREE